MIEKVFIEHRGGHFGYTVERNQSLLNRSVNCCVSEVKRCYDFTLLITVPVEWTNCSRQNVTLTGDLKNQSTWPAAE